MDGICAVGQDCSLNPGESFCGRLDRFSIVKEDQSSMSKGGTTSRIRRLKPGCPEFSSGEVKRATGRRMNFFQYRGLLGESTIRRI